MKTLSIIAVHFCWAQVHRQRQTRQLWFISAQVRKPVLITELQNVEVLTDARVKLWALI